MPEQKKVQNGGSKSEETNEQQRQFAIQRIYVKDVSLRSSS